jgi:uncharacterized protein
LRISTKDIEESPKELAFEQSTAELNRLFEQGPVHDFRFPEPAVGRLTCYRSGAELFFAGELVGNVVGECGRCAEDFEFRLVVPFAAVFVPRGQAGTDEDEDDGDLYFYDQGEVDLTPLLDESILLALPTLPLCQEACRGLCPRCGINRNTASCDCETSQGDSRLAVLRDLKLKG